MTKRDEMKELEMEGLQAKLSLHCPLRFGDVLIA
jgi:hypothetical protein